ncbi:MAG: hypothetical protein M1150_04085 [Patescibacteria group bacterium]|nr:hypothetical protein [Patescibacteria group bacterium]
MEETPRCPRCNEPMRKHPEGWVCDNCGHMETTTDEAKDSKTYDGLPEDYPKRPDQPYPK